MYRELSILLPCHSLEDFPVHHVGEEADNLLAAWTALWHPVLIAAAAAGPQWRRADDPPGNLESHLLAVPDVSVRQLPAGFLQHAKTEGAVVLRSGKRDELLAQALEPLQFDSAASPELVADFLALGYCFLQVELLTRQMRYASNLDELHFRQQLVAAAQAAVAGDEATAREKLTLCFDLLSEEREHYYSVDAYLIDLTLVASTTLAAGLRAELQQPQPMNVLISGDDVVRMAEAHPESLECLRQAINECRVGLLGGEDRESRWPMLGLETLLAHLKHGLAVYQQHLGARPGIFARRRFGLTPLLPGLLTGMDFHAALHATLDDGRFPQGGQIKTRWEGSDGSAIDALARVPLDASEPGVFLSLALRLGESMDMDHVATLAFAHWPSQASPWYTELRRVARHTPALGRFLTLESYFRDTTLPGRLDRFEAHQYRSPYLKQAIIRRQTDPISSVIRYWQAVAARRVSQTLECWKQLTTNASDNAQRNDVVFDDEGATDASAEQQHALNAIAEFSASITRNGPSGPGLLLVNPFPSKRTWGVQLSADISPTGPNVLAADAEGRAVVEVPGLGFAHVGGDSPSSTEKKPAKKRKKEVLLADELLLRNEFFEVRIHPQTGAAVSIRSYSARNNLLSQQLGFRLPQNRPAKQSGEWYETDDTPYTQMVASEIRVTAASEVFGEIQSQGRLLAPDGSEVAGYRQTCRVWRASRVLSLEIELDPRVEPRADPWNSYFACRFAWGDESAILTRSLHETRQRIERGPFEAPHFIEIDDGKARVAILTCGLPFHRMVDYRMLDTLLITRGESQRRFQLGIAVDSPQPLLDSLDLLGPAPLHAAVSAAPPTAAGWLFHLGVKNIVPTHWEALCDQGRVVGFRVRLLETSGRATRAPLAAMRALRSARTLDFLGRPLGDCAVEDGKVVLTMAAYEWQQLEARWDES